MKRQNKYLVRIAINDPRSFKCSHLAGWFLKDQHWTVEPYDDELPKITPDWLLFAYDNDRDWHQLNSILNWASEFSVNIQISCSIDQDLTSRVFDRAYTNFVQILQHTDLYGSREQQPVSAVQNFITQAEHTGRVNISEQYKKIKQDLLWIGDLCKVHIDFIKTVNGSGCWQIGSGIQHNLEDVAEEVAESFEAIINYVDNCPLYRSSRADVKELKNLIGSREMLNIYQWIEYQAKY